ncbi:hypothetical protein BH09ACT8_BH09ACT8_62340 [soil metagenome]
MGSISRGWALARQSWYVLKSDPSLIIFPILSTVFAMIATVAIWVPVVVIRGLFTGGQVEQNDPVYYVAGVVTAYVATFIAIFFNVALAACTVRAMQGEDTTVGQGIGAAMRRLGPIIGWSLVTTTVGLLLRALEERLPLAGRIAAWLVGAAWAIATFFVIPIVALEDGGPVHSLKRSAAIVKERWGEGATGAATISIVTFVVGFVVLAIGAGGAVAMVSLGQSALAVVIGALAVAAVIVVSMMSTALSQIFRVAVYQYAVTGRTPDGFDGQMLQAAFSRH